jgi:hypothetical protein
VDVKRKKKNFLLVKSLSKQPESGSALQIGFELLIIKSFSLKPISF